MRSGPISRVLSRTVIYLGARVAASLFARYPSADRAGPWRSYSRLLRMGFTQPSRRRDAGGLLHHRFSFSLYARTQVGVFFSAALSVGSLRLAVSQHAALWSPDFPHESAKRPRATVWPASEGDCSTVGPASADAGSPCHPQGSSAPAARFATHCPVGGRGSRHQPCLPRFNRGGRILRGLQAGRASRVRTMACPH